MDIDEFADPALRAKRQADNLISGSIDRSIRLVVWLFGGVILLTAAGVTGWSSLGNRVATLERTDTGIEKRVDEMYPKVMFMDEMRQFGVTNKEDFYRQHGYQAPSLSLAQPEITGTPPRRP